VESGHPRFGMMLPTRPGFHQQQVQISTNSSSNSSTGPDGGERGNTGAVPDSSGISGDMETEIRGEYGTILEIQSVRMLPDGRSLVETIGTERFKLLERGSLDGYGIGRIER